MTQAPVSLSEMKKPSQEKQHTAKKFEITQQVDSRGKRSVIYAPGGWGKTSISAMAPGAVILDLEGRTGHVASKLAQHNYPLNRIAGLGVGDDGEVDAAEAFADVRHVLHNYDMWQPGMTVVIDSMTKLEEMSYAWVVRNIRTEKGAQANSIEDYGYGKGFVYGHEQMVKVLQDLDMLSRRGVHSILICHDCIANFDDPAQVGEHKRYEPRLYRSASGNTDTRLRVREWSDAVLFGTYEMAKNKEGRVTGHGTRIVYTQERPAFMAKSSLPPELFQIPVQHEYDGTVWTHVFEN